MIAEHDENEAPRPDTEVEEREELHEELDFEPEEELGDLGAAQAKIKKLRGELERIKKERQEYLDGWQRCKADSINARKDASASASRVAETLREALVHDIIPVLDSFDMAASSEQWDTVEPGWRSGMEHVRNQLIDALERHGIRRFGRIGDLFDPLYHDIVQETDGPGEQHSVLKIVRSGYKTGDRILRPAQVIIKS